MFRKACKLKIVLRHGREKRLAGREIEQLRFMLAKKMK